MSRVHQLGRMSLDELVNLHDRLRIAAPRSIADRMPPGGYDRDRLITWIRDLEDPQEGNDSDTASLERHPRSR